MACTLLAAQPAGAVRIKDIATFKGVRSNQLVGYGLVVGLGGTGDQRGSDFTIQSLVNMLDKMGVRVNRADIKPKNVAAVMVTANMMVSATPGSKMDVTVSSIGDAKNLLGGQLLLTPLKGIDGNVYATAQGALTLGGFLVQGTAAQAQKNTTTVAIIPNGATVERGVPFNFNDMQNMTLNLSVADFSTTMQAVKAINREMGGDFAKARDISTIDIAVPQKFQGNLVPLMASLENIEIEPQTRARVVVDEKTGTVVLGQDVRLGKVAVAHGNLQIVVSNSAQVSQPPAFSGGQTVAVPQTTIGVTQQNKRLMLMEGATLRELVDGLNAIGASPQDLISILRALKAAGALMADVEVI
ncbi:flagellar basal body P-ring protein FlgI [Desulfovibrio sp. X2]|uniref:flagellar basal body P-ring protein FlgI n=1 Tax=Desulfovibrio sp. X2 TaxID=941449 RepID=UPI001267EBB9|nr:flagellar basal body P-ring protein FlgI [Desulfovibrio sp. X2]